LIEATEMPALLNACSAFARRASLSLTLQPPPWMNTTSGAGELVFARQKSSRCRLCFPYGTSACVGGGNGARSGRLAC